MLFLPDVKKDSSSNWKNLFREHGIQPDVIRSIPKSRLEVLKQPTGSRIETASSVRLEDLKETPEFRWKSDPKKLYSLFLLNPDVPSRREAFEVFQDLHKFKIRHFLAHFFIFY